MDEKYLIEDQVLLCALLNWSLYLKLCVLLFKETDSFKGILKKNMWKSFWPRMEGHEKIEQLRGHYRTLAEQSDGTVEHLLARK